VTPDLKLRRKLIRLAHSKPELRPALLSLLSKTAGGAEFQEYGEGTDPKKVFEKLVQDAENDVRSYRDDDSEGGYSGTILEKAGKGFVLRAKGMTLAEAKTYANQDVRHNPKSGPAFAIPVVSGRAETKAKKVVLRADSDEEARSAFGTWARASGALPGKIRSVRDTGEKDKFGFGSWEVRGDIVLQGSAVGFLFYGIAAE